MRIYKSILSIQECFDLIVKYRKQLNTSYILQGRINKQIRHSKSYLFHDEILQKKFESFSLTSNIKFQLTEYIKGGYYIWHEDNTAGRIQTHSVLLNNNFIGGELELEIYGDVLLSIGDCISFDSALSHQIKPLTMGIRYSLVAWVYQTI
jgi:predicted 2-oxoglutarate/Fe(II)-dependent dioxygenase YbiX